MSHRKVYRMLITGVLLLIASAVANVLHWRSLIGVSVDLKQIHLPITLIELAILLIFAAAGSYARFDKESHLAWQLWGIGLAGYGLLYTLYVVLSLDDDIIWRIALHGPLTLASVPLMLWLMVRYSVIAPLWVDTARRFLAGWVLIAGVLLCLDTQSLAMWSRWLIAGIILLAHVVIAAHCYHGLSNSNPQQRTLAAHWHGQAVLLLLVMVGFLGFVRAISGAALDDTWLGTLPEMGKLAALVALGLGLVNQVIAEMRQQVWRVTGLIPFWMVAAGWWLWLFTLAAMGSVQVIFNRIAYRQSPDDLAPLLHFAVGAGVLIVIGMLIYGLGLAARRVYFDKES